MLKVLIAGTGFAGQGHAEAFRGAGAEIVGMVGRTAHVVTEVAEKMGIPYAGTDWQAALAACTPDIVSIATPGGAHYEPIKQAIEVGCHVFVDKPMTESGETAVELFELAAGEGRQDRLCRELPLYALGAARETPGRRGRHRRAARGRMHLAFQPRTRDSLWLVAPRRRGRRPAQQQLHPYAVDRVLRRRRQDPADRRRGARRSRPRAHRRRACTTSPSGATSSPRTSTILRSNGAKATSNGPTP